MLLLAFAAVLLVAVLAHSSTDVLVARSFDEARETPAWDDAVRDRLRRTP